MSIHTGWGLGWGCLLTGLPCADGVIQYIALLWISLFLEQAGRALLPLLSNMLIPVLPCVAYGSDKEGILPFIAGMGLSVCVFVYVIVSVWVVVLFPDSLSAIKLVAASVNTVLRDLVRPEDDEDVDSPVRIMVEDTVEEQDTLWEVPPEEVPGPSPPPQEETPDGDARLEVISVSGCGGNGSGCGTLTPGSAGSRSIPCRSRVP